MTLATTPHKHLYSSHFSFELWCGHRSVKSLLHTMLAILKLNKCETYQQKIINALIIEKHILVGSYFCTKVSRLLYFDTDDGVSFDTKYFFLFLSQISKKHKNPTKKIKTKLKYNI